MPDLAEHTVELLERVMHRRIEQWMGYPIACELRVTHEAINANDDIFEYPVWCEWSDIASRVKRNWKHCVAAIGNRFRAHGIRLDLQLDLSLPIGPSQYMMLSDPPWHAQNLDILWHRLLNEYDNQAMCLRSDTFDPFLVAYTDSWMYDQANWQQPDYEEAQA
jgi:hypothetical protein